MSTADTQLLEYKIQKLLKLLNNFNAMREEGVTRQEYVDDLKSLFCKLYGYNSELMDLFLDVFGHTEVKHSLFV
jgi:ribosomal RNA methyltransferase Nop2